MIGYGFNGMEKDGNFGNTHYDYGFRIYNPQIGNFLSVDPLIASYPWYTPYQFAGNNPIYFEDLDGLEPRKREIPLYTSKKKYTAEEINEMASSFYHKILKDNFISFNNGVHKFQEKEAYASAIALIDPSGTKRTSEFTLGQVQEIHAQFREFKENASVILEKYDFFLFNSQLQIQREKEANQRAKELAIRRGILNLKKYQALMEAGRVDAYFDMAVGGSGLIVAGIFWESGPAAYAGAVFSADQFVGGTLKLYAIENGLFDSNKEYKIIKGAVIDTFGEGGAVVYDFASIISNTRGTVSTLSKLNGASKLAGKELNSIIETIDTSKTISDY